ncbi:MAG: hypothetical protein L0I24_20950, partial [Pseudonocardia sp.]|nr:hypothetical protein [Pseudonocardia sp.]
MLSPYPQLVIAGFRRHSTYRQAALAGLTTNIVFGLLRAAVLVAVLVLMYALAATAFGIADLTVGQAEELPTYIRTG